MSRLSPRRDWLAVWIIWSTWCGVTGWFLSAIGHLDRAGYAVTTLIFIVGLVAFRRQPATSARPAWILRRTTYTPLLPKLWLGLTLLVLAGGLLYHPDNFDYLTYRFGRLLHWWVVGHWYWIDTLNVRQNNSSVGIEWLMAPLFILFRTDRLFFLINFVSWLFLPGLIFSVFRRLGIGGRIAWTWMWVLPAGFCFVLQAASMGNDAFAAIYFLAALHYAFKARNGAARDLVLSLLAIALLTGAKASNIPLMLPWLVVLGLNRQSLRAAFRPVLLAAACVVAAAISYLPMALLNIHFMGEYTGDPTNFERLKVVNPVAGIAGNGLEIAVANLSPPLWPHELHWPFQEEMIRLLKPGYLRFELNTVPLQIEEIAGVGPGVVALAALGMIFGWLGRFRLNRRAPDSATWLIAGSVAAAWLAYMLKMGSEAAPRLVTVYYIAGLAALLLVFPVPASVVRLRAWRGVVLATMAIAFVLVVLNPSRPLFPVDLTGAALRLAHAPASAIAQLEGNYRLRSERRDGLAPLRQSIPSTEAVVGGVIGSDDPVVSLWLPFGSRQVVEVNPTTADLAADRIHYVVVNGNSLNTRYHLTIDDLEKKWSMRVAGQEELGFKTARKGTQWYLLAPATSGPHGS